MYGEIEIRRVSGMMYMPKSMSLSGGTLGRLLGTTFENSLTMESNLREGTSTLESLTHTK